jgi:uncharacterized protein YcbX
MPVVTHLNIAPVASLGLEARERIDLTERGVAEDRRFFIVNDTDRHIDQLTAARMVQVAAWTDAEGTSLRMTFPDGGVVEDDVRLGAAYAGSVYKHPVNGHVVEGPWADALSAFLHRPVRIIRCDEPGGTRADGRASLMTAASLDRLGHHLGVGGVDGRRFRMLIQLSGETPHEEDGWIGKQVELGETILRITGAVPRCAMTTHDPDSGERDLDTLHAIREYRGLTGESGKDLMFGVYGDVDRPGSIRLGDAIRVLD